MINLMKKLSYVFTRKQKWQLVGILIIITIGAFLELMGVSIIMPFVNSVLSPESIRDNSLLNWFYEMFRFTSNNQFIIFLAMAVIIIYIVKNIFLAYMYDVQYHFTFDNQRKLSAKMMECYIRQPYFYHLSHGSGEMIQNITNDAAMFFAVVLGATQFLTESIVCIVLILYLLMKDVSITFGIASVMVIFLLFYFFVLKKKIQRLGIQYRKNNADMNKHIIEGFGGIKEVKVLDREDYFVNAYDLSYREYAECFRKFQVYSILPRPLMEAVCITGLMLVVVLKIASGVEMSYFVPTLSVFVVAAFRMLPSFSRITSHLSTVVFNKSAVDSVYRDLQEINSLSITKNNNHNKVLEFEDKIEIEQLSFTYPNSSKEVLHAVDFCIKKHQSVGLIGPSGQGKTTLADIILGVLQPSKGRVLLDGADISENMYAWHMKLGYIPQTIFLSDDTIRRNIAYGIQDSEIDDQRVWKAVEEAQLKTFVESLEKGIETEVGERGVRLSGGQRQRIGIARALYNNPDILVLDEATSALDNDTETAVMEAINRLQGNKTLIIIAHRLTTIKSCDAIYEVNDGNVTEVNKKVLFAE